MSPCIFFNAYIFGTYNTSGTYHIKFKSTYLCLESETFTAMNDLLFGLTYSLNTYILSTYSVTY